MKVSPYGFLIYIFSTILLFNCEDTLDNSIISLTKIPNQPYYYLGSSVTFSCKLNLKEKNNIVLFRKGKSIKSEMCVTFNKEKYGLECSKIEENGITLEDYRFTIKQTSWEDRGPWECLYAQSSKIVEVEIRVIPKFDPLRVFLIGVPVQEKVDSMNQATRLVGRGSRTNPYNLRDGSAVNITCLSSCSYPETFHKWIYQNISYPPVEITEVSRKRRDLCTLDSNKGMMAAESVVTINCSTLKIVGANIVVCASNVTTEVNNSSVYVLCPGGERPWELTTGEMVGVAVSVGIFILLVVFLCFLVRRSRYSHVPGDVSTNTYTSGVRV